MRIVLDTTILVRANESSQGLARELLLKIVTSHHRLLLCSEMLFELAKVLRYPRMRDLHGLPEHRIYDYIGFLRQISELVPVNPLLIVPIRDVNDIVVVQTAVFGGADVICTTDDDFYDHAITRFLNRQEIAVMDDITLIQRLRS